MAYVTESRFESLGFLNIGGGTLRPGTGKDGLLINDVDACTQSVVGRWLRNKWPRGAAH